MHVDLLSILKKIVKKVYWNSKWYQGVRISITSNVSIKSEFEAPCQIHSDVVYRGRMGMGSYIACGSILSADIGRFTSIGAFVRSTAGRHPYQSPFATTSHAITMFIFTQVEARPMRYYLCKKTTF